MNFAVESVSSNLNAPDDPSKYLQGSAAQNNSGGRDEAEIEAWLRLSFVGLSAGRCRSALARWGDAAALLEAARSGRDDELLATSGLTPTSVERLREAATRDIERARQAILTHQMRLLLDSDDDYPASLRAIPDPPPYLWMRGSLEPSDEIAIAIVGTRHTTEYGRGVAAKLAADLAQHGITVVSGLARGVDTAAHRGALESGGRTFACCGCGLDVTYPAENKNLMEQIIAQGACFSEFAPTTHPEPWHFPARNRIISGLSTGVIIVEAGERSGALITADFAMEQGREVFAVPGNIHKAQSRGAHGLIKQGATLVDSVDDVLQALQQRTLPFARKTPAAAQTELFPASTLNVAGAGESAAQSSAPPVVRPDLSPAENRVYLALEVESRHVDDIADSAQMGAAEVNAALVMLELKNLARRLPGAMFERVK